jgi:hypothetical protein
MGLKAIGYWHLKGLFIPNNNDQTLTQIIRRDGLRRLRTRSSGDERRSPDGTGTRRR